LKPLVVTGVTNFHTHTFSLPVAIMQVHHCCFNLPSGLCEQTHAHS